MKSNFLRILMALAFAAFAFSACEKNSYERIQQVDGDGPKSRAMSIIVWNGATDIAVAVNIAETKSARTNASGIKITSNAHSADFPGLYFIWDSKQKHNGYLKVDASVFEKYASFVLTSKESKTYWDFKIALQDGQQKTADNCYVFFIPKVYNNKNINMVFLEEFSELPPPQEDPKEYLISVMSGQDFGVPVTSLQTNGVPYMDAWDGGIVRTNWSFDAIAELGFRDPALWAWNIANSLETGIVGSTVTFDYAFSVGGEVINFAKMAFAADNAIAIWINGQLVGMTKATAFDGDGRMNVLNGAYGADGWSEVCEFDIEALLPFLKQGVNTLKIMARNAANGAEFPNADPNNKDTSNNIYNTTNNPGGVLFALVVASQDPDFK